GSIMRHWFRTPWQTFLGAAARRPPRSRRPALEPLEDRTVPSAGFIQVNLVSDQPHRAVFTDPHLVNAWGITASASSPFWVTANGTALATVYSFGTPPPGSPFGPQALVVTIPPPTGGMPPAAPTGIVFNGNTNDFILSSNNHAVFVFATEDGTISGWN